MDQLPVTDILWVLTSAVLVLLMQGGFLCVESGLTRSKNAINVALKNASDFLIATLAWFLVGFGIMFGHSHLGVIGVDRFVPAFTAESYWETTFFLFQLVFCATASTIISGAVAERMRFNGYHLVTLLTVALIYPVYGHWAWGGALGGPPGWLAAIGFVDFAGSTVVHSIGGWVALAAVLVIGPRIGRFDQTEPRVIPGSNLPLAMLGVLFFLVGWIGFNGGSTLALNASVPAIIAKTLLSGAAGGIAAHLLLKRWSSPNLDPIAIPLNGVIAGLVAITAGCHVVTTWNAVAIGAFAAVLLVASTEWLAQRRIDDPIGALPVHLVAGIWGTLAVALFGDPDLIGTGLPLSSQLAVQGIGIVVAGAWAFPTAYLVLRLIDRFYPLRVSREDELNGLNVSEHGARTELVDLLGALDTQQRTADLSLRIPVEPFTEVGQIAARHNLLMDALEQAETRSRAIVRDLRDGIVTFRTEQALLTSLNPGAEQILGLHVEDAVGISFPDLLDLDGVTPEGMEPGGTPDTVFQALIGNGKFEVPLRRKTPAGPVYVEIAAMPDSREQGSYTGLIRDVSDRRRIEEQLFEEKELAQTTLESIADGVVTTDAAGRVCYLNAVATQLTGWSQELAAGQPLHRVFPVVDSPTEIPDSWIARRVLGDGETVIDSKSRLLYCRDGNVHVVQHTAAPIRNAAGKITGLVVVFHDKTQARAMERQLTYQAKHDALTGLINRREFEERLSQVIDRLEDGPARHLLCYIDLDQFKLVNDVCGHAAGDALLRQVASLLKRSLRSADTLARLGGDEFGVILDNCAVERGVEIAEAMRERVHNFRFAWNDKVFAIGASIGLVPLSHALGNLAEALSRADAACFAAKDTGRNRVHVYDPDNREVRLRKGQMKWVTRIQRALDEDRFQLYYQGIAPLAQPDDVDSHFEILLRMTDDACAEGESVPPGAFIPAAERYGLMPEIDHWVVDHTLRWLAAYQAAGGDRIRRCAINLSGATLGNDKHTARIRERLSQYRIEPSLICFEITETAAMANLEQAQRFIEELKQIGCRFALDDFGSGLSSFGYLRELAVDIVKIDGSFIREIDHNPVDRAMVEAIVAIAGVMGLDSTAEFVENARALDLLREIGVTYAQGYHLARPRPLDAYPMPLHKGLAAQS